MIQDKWEHIGDGVYICFDGYGYQLHANDHLHPTDRIYLGRTVAEVLMTKMNEEHKVK